MVIPDGYTDLTPGKIASVVTYLEMSEPPAGPPVAGNSKWAIRSQANPDLGWYRHLFRAVGEEWLWFSRLRMDDSVLSSIIHNRAVDVFALEIEGLDKGILELDRRERPDIELAFIGLTRDVIGSGAGKYLLDQAIRLAWAYSP